jgi:hypothetical protein
MMGFLDGTEAGGLSHAELERRLDIEGRELLRQLLQDHLDPPSHWAARWKARLTHSE